MALYRLDQPSHNFQPRYNICPTDPIDTIVAQDGKRDLSRMRWGLVPRWWSKPLKELRLATFNVRAETATEKSFFRQAFKRGRCLIPVSGYYERQDTPGDKQPLVFHRPRPLPCPDDRRLMGCMARSGHRPNT